MIVLSIVLVLALVIGWLVYGAADISSGVFVDAFCREKTDEKRVYLTFDDGPSPGNTEAVLDVLAKYGAKGCFFCIGSNLSGNEEIVRRIAGSGNDVGCHSWTHSPFFPLYSRRRMVDEMRRCASVMGKITGRDIILFRPPFGVTNPTVSAAVRLVGCKTVGWSIRTYDTTGKSPEQVLEKIRRKLRPGAVILLHDRLPQCASTVELILHHLMSDGYRADRSIMENFISDRSVPAKDGQLKMDLKR